MEANARRSNNAQILRSLSPPGRSYSSKYQTSSLLPTRVSVCKSAASTTSNKYSLDRRISSPCSTSRSSTSVYKSAASTTSNKYSLDRRTSSHCSTSRTSTSVYKSAASTPSARTLNSPNRPVSVSDNRKPAGPSHTKRTCLCSPTNHPGSFRCSLHKNTGNKTTSFVSNKLERSAMANSLVRHGAIEGDLVKRALAALIRPSSHQLRRRENFQRRPSRLSVMSEVTDCPVLTF